MCVNLINVWTEDDAGLIEIPNGNEKRESNFAISVCILQTVNVNKPHQLLDEGQHGLVRKAISLGILFIQCIPAQNARVSLVLPQVGPTARA